MASRRLKPEASLKWTLGRHRLVAERWGGRWTFSCPTMPDLAERWSGSEDTAAALEEFGRRAASEAVERDG